MVLELWRWIRRHLSLGALRERLLPGAASAEADVEMTSADTPVRLPGQLALSPHVTIIPQRLRDFLTAALIAALLFFSTVFLSIFVIMEWASRPDQRGWLLLGFGFYIVSAMQRLWSTMVPLFRSVMSIRVEIRRFASATLFEAVTDFLAKEAERQGLTCSWDQEALQEHDKLTGKIQVKLRFWSSQARTMRISVRIPSDLESPDPEPPESLDMKVEFLPGDDIVCGRDARLERREILILNVFSNEKRALADKRLLVRWLEHAYVQFVKPIQDVVNVYSLQESSADWVPEWKFERVKTCKRTADKGQRFYLERESLDEILADAKLWSKSTLRVYMITGPPGVGKSEFTVWIAGQLGLPVYRLSLSSPKLSDDRLSQLLSQSSISFNSVLLQVDEFQETLQRWLAGPSAPAEGVTAGGFCEVLQGSTSMSQGVVILTGTTELEDTHIRSKLPAVYRRINGTARLSWMTQADIGSYFQQFLSGFVLGMAEDAWVRHVQSFLALPSWDPKQRITIDMLKQYLMKKITEACRRNLGQFVTKGDEDTFFVGAEHTQTFFDLLCEEQASKEFLRNYASVHQSDQS